MTTLEETIHRTTADSLLIVGFSAIALLLAAAGLYGVLAYLIAQRRTEIGIRIALGAQREQVARLMLGDGLRPALYGLVLGLGASVAVTRLIDSMLYQTRSGGAGRGEFDFAGRRRDSVLPAWRGVANGADGVGQPPALAPSCQSSLQGDGGHENLTVISRAAGVVELTL